MPIILVTSQVQYIHCVRNKKVRLTNRRGRAMRFVFRELVEPVLQYSAHTKAPAAGITINMASVLLVFMICAIVTPRQPTAGRKLCRGGSRSQPGGG